MNKSFKDNDVVHLTCMLVGMHRTGSCKIPAKLLTILGGQGGGGGKVMAEKELDFENMSMFISKFKPHFLKING